MKAPCAAAEAALAALLRAAVVGVRVVQHVHRSTGWVFGPCATVDMLRVAGSV